MRYAIILSLALAAATTSAPAGAQNITPNSLASVDPATVAVPSLTFTTDKEATDNFWRFFIFHKDGVSFATAVTDVAECEGYSKINDMFVPVPSSAPYGTASRNAGSKVQERKYDPWTPQYGLVGYTIGKLLIGATLARLYNTNQRNCMGFKGYTPYGVTEDIWRSINKGEQEQIILIKAKIASSPIPMLQESRP